MCPFVETKFFVPWKELFLLIDCKDTNYFLILHKH